MTGLLRSVQGDSATGEWWRPSYLLVASYDVTTDGTVLDCNSGRTGVFSRMSGCTFVGPASLGGLLAEAADGLEQGRALFIDMDEEEIADQALDAVPLNERAVIWP
ncbi:hypothetical protein SAMN05216252_12126 [Actinacidiphila glaucinigra]|uniref:Uncharacterized protein n=2 Tax=Actinacidiphila glaucinigra TaxID=235986 RepID=A0A239LR43_9ACTN|nr:hypothetical protein SAMN05216252_12126 [Actinacidiphila glaucinigra]